MLVIFWMARVAINMSIWLFSTLKLLGWTKLPLYPPVSPPRGPGCFYNDPRKTGQVLWLTKVMLHLQCLRQSQADHGENLWSQAPNALMMVDKHGLPSGTLKRLPKPSMIAVGDTAIPCNNHSWPSISPSILSSCTSFTIHPSVKLYWPIFITIHHDENTPNPWWLYGLNMLKLFRILNHHQCWLPPKTSDCKILQGLNPLESSAINDATQPPRTVRYRWVVRLFNGRSTVYYTGWWAYVGTVQVNQVIFARFHGDGRGGR